MTKYNNINPAQIQDSSLLDIRKLNELEGLSVGIRYFDDPYTIYVSPSLFEDVYEKKSSQLQYMVLSYRKGQKDIVAIANEIIDELKKTPPGRATNEVLENVMKNRDVQSLPDVTVPTGPPSTHQYSTTGKKFVLKSTAYDKEDE